MGKTLYKHAQDELKRLDLISDGEPDSLKIATDTLALVRRFEKQNHNAHTGKWVLEFFETICNFLPLSPITDDPAEWEGFEDSHKNLETDETVITKRWQNRRAPSIISMDGGKTFVDLRSNKEGTSVDHVQQAKDWAADKAARKAAKKAAEEAKKAPKQATAMLANPPADTSVPAGEDTPAVAPKAEEAKETK